MCTKNLFLGRIITSMFLFSFSVSSFCVAEAKKESVKSEGVKLEEVQENKIDINKKYTEKEVLEFVKKHFKKEVNSSNVFNFDDFEGKKVIQLKLIEIEEVMRRYDNLFELSIVAENKKTKEEVFLNITIENVEGVLVITEIQEV